MPWVEKKYYLERPLLPWHALVISLLAALVCEIALRPSGIQPHLEGVIAGRVLAVFLGLYCVHHFAARSLSSYRPQLKDFLYLNLIFMLTAVMTAAGLVVSMGLSTYSHSTAYLGGISPRSLEYFIPFAAGGLLVQSILGLHYTLVFSIFLSLILSVYIPNQPLMLTYALVTTLAGALSMVRFRSRSAFTRAGLNVALVALPIATASLLIQDGSAYTQGDVVARLFGAVFNGVQCSFIAAGFAPVIEYLGGYVSDLRLVEMATLDHPLLKSLSVNAPGTWNHSMVMGMMAEAAAEAIGANPIVARVGAYFHDIGKTKKPLYFAENQHGGENRHDKLSSSMSALIIRSHVKDGVELARQHALPKVIVDMIPQHHGTALIEYFYEKACSEAAEASGVEIEVDPSLYSYPGPKPQSREAGILMLADGTEAAARTISEPSSDRIQGLVQKMINKVFASGQLDECELTLNDLHAIAASFTRVLSGIYHQRVAYAESAEKVHDREELPDEQSSAEAPQETETPESAKRPRTGPEDKTSRDQAVEDLKRLGLEQDTRPGLRGKHSIH